MQTSLFSKSIAPWLLALGLTVAGAATASAQQVTAADNGGSAATDQGAAPAATNPLSVKIGGWDFTPGGFLDFTSVFRSTDVGSGIGTNFAGIPYTNSGGVPVATARETEFRESAQNSRFALKAAGDADGFATTAYTEVDFLGNQSTNAAVSSNSITLRMRVFFADVKKGNWEVAAGQDWSLLTPSKFGADPMPSNVFYTQNMDTNYQVGLVWARQPQFRLIYHASPNFAAAISVENPEQYVGGSSGAPTVTLPQNGVYASQVDSGASNFSDPGFSPDIIAKLAYDTSTKPGHGVHVELSGLESEFRVFTPSTGITTRTAGGGASFNVNAEVVSNFHLILNSYLSDGGGRYFFGMAPDIMIRQNGVISPIHAGGGMLGFEYQTTPNWLLDAYYGGVYIGKDADYSGSAPIGYGFNGTGSSNSFNRSIQEGSLGVIYTFWKNAQYGDLKLITQGAYLSRNPWVVGTGPRDAHVGMVFADIRYDLP